MAAAYDGIAAEYDRLVAEDAWMRERLWAHHLRRFRAGDRVLDVACGTGLDTLHLAARGLRMTGVDASLGMLAALRRKAAARDLAGSVAVCAADAACLEGWPAGCAQVRGTSVAINKAIAKTVRDMAQTPGMESPA